MTAPSPSRTVTAETLAAARPDRHNTIDFGPPPKSPFLVVHGDIPEAEIRALRDAILAALPVSPTDGLPYDWKNDPDDRRGDDWGPDPVSPTDGLDVAWARAEAALPAKWRLAGLWRINKTWTATALELPRHRGPGLGRAGDAQGLGSTPAAALNALAARLEVTRESE